MKKQITANQHYVPQHYMKLWGDVDNKVWWHDLERNIQKSKPTKKILSKDFFYELNKNEPTNEVEDILTSIENRAAPVLKRIAGLQALAICSAEHAQEEVCERAGKILAEGDSFKYIMEFISAQLIRTPIVNNQIKNTINKADIPDSVKKTLNDKSDPASLVKLGLQKLPPRFLKHYNFVLGHSQHTPFVTSDHPVLELFSHTPELFPQPGYDILHGTKVLVLFPLSPNFHCMLIHKDNDSKKFHPPYKPKTFQVKDLLNLSILWMLVDEKILDFFRGAHVRFDRRFLISNREETSLLSNHSQV
ncbi:MULTISPECIES: DUF4238 domain-containing protein [Pseudomonas syringae group]|nr:MULTISPECIES: DUF4238 domain-containing protein [Pseudomonas syringae group]